MLNARNQPFEREVPLTRDDIFLTNYNQLRIWALHFSEGNKPLAEDLLHDAFIQFTISEVDLTSIQNVDAYLYVLMRNLHVSQARRATRNPVTPLAAVDFDTANVGLWASDPRDRIRLREELCTVCEYACIRKQSAKAGSVLILRFFHGYYPEEIARIMKVDRAAVHNRLHLARAEAKSFLEDPDKLAFFKEAKVRSIGIKVDEITGDLRLQLRQAIFDTRRGACIDAAEIDDVYHDEDRPGPDQQILAHMVSCAACIENVNTTLGIAPLASRYPVDSIGNDPKRRGGGPTGGGPTGGGGGGIKMNSTLYGRRDEVIHHEPHELCVSVNGYLQGSHRVSSDLNEMTLVIDGSDNLGFIEVFSEQGLRLLMLNVELPPAGDTRQEMRTQLSDGRFLDASLAFNGTSPVLKVVYHDPTLVAESAAADITVAPALPATAGTDAGRGLVPDDKTPELFTSVNKGRSWFSLPRLTIAFATLLAVAFVGYWLITLPPKPLTASDVLANAATAEAAMIAAPNQVLHRNYSQEQWVNGELRSRSRVDEWQQATAKAERTYDENGRMIAGRWTKADGTGQAFQQGEKLKSVPPTPTTGDDLEPTIAGFNSLVRSYGVASQVLLDQSQNDLSLTYKKPNGEPGGLLLASIALDRESLRPRGESIVLQIGDERREYRFTDVRLEVRPSDEVSPLIFEPEAELVRGGTKVTKPNAEPQPATADADTAANTTAPATATLDTEVEVMKALDSVNALSGDQIAVTRAADGRLKVSGIVDSPARKTEILNALITVRNSPGVDIDILTASEAQARKKNANIQAGDIRIDSVTAETRQQLAVEPELRAFLAKRGVSEERMPDEIRSFSANVLNRAEALSRNALSLKSLAERFSPADLAALEPKKREEWRSLIHSKAAAVAGDVRSLQSQIGSIVGAQSMNGDAGDTRDTASAAQRLYGLAAACERQVNQSFAVSSNSSAAVRSPQFWRNLAQMGAIANELQRF